MEASIKEGNIKHFVRLLQCASRFGDELNMHANKDSWELAVTNSSKSAFCLFKLKPSFFCRYKALGETSVVKKRGVKCQLLVKSVLAVLGKATSVANVERLDLTIVDPERSLRRKRKRESDTSDEEEEIEDELQQGLAAKLVMKLVCKHGVTKKHSLHLGPSQFLRVEVDPDSTPSSFSVSARSLRDVIDHFSFAAPGFNANGFRGEHQLGWMFAGGEVRMKSWETGQTSLSTEIKLDPSGEFVNYWLEGDRVDLTVPMKEFRAALTLAEQLSIQLLVAFSVPTQPLTIIGPVNDEGQAVDEQYEIFCAIATTNCEAFADAKPTGPGGNVAGIPRLSRTTSQAGRSRLAMSTEPSSRVIHAVLPPDANAEPLFLPGNGSQEAPSSQSHRPKLSQADVLRMSGLDEVSAQDLFEDFDEMDHEDELEELSTLQMVHGQGGLVADGTIDGIPSIRNDFEPNDLLDNNADLVPEHARQSEEMGSDEEMDESQQRLALTGQFNALFDD